MSEARRRCPHCGADLQLSHREGLTIFECPAAHGAGINLVEAYGHLHRDELEAIWDASKRAPLSKLRSPLSGTPMAEVTFLVDEDMRTNESVNAREMTIEVDVENHFGWFGFDELKSMPVDRDKRGPSAPGLVGLDQMHAHKETHGHVFDDLSPGDMEEVPTEGKVSNLLTGLARKLRG